MHTELETYTFLELQNDGEWLVMLDGSSWWIPPGDMPTVATWIPTTEIKVTLIDEGSAFPYELDNDGIKVRASRLT